MERTLKSMFMRITNIDTLIVLGLLIIIGMMTRDVQLMIVGGLLATLKTTTQGGSDAP